MYQTRTSDASWEVKLDACFDAACDLLFPKQSLCWGYKSLLYRQLLVFFFLKQERGAFMNTISTSPEPLGRDEGGSGWETSSDRLYKVTNWMHRNNLQEFLCFSCCLFWFWSLFLTSCRRFFRLCHFNIFSCNSFGFSHGKFIQLH